MVDARDDGFFSRWARRKAEARRGGPAAEPVTPPVDVAAVPAAPIPAAPPRPAAAVPTPPTPTPTPSAVEDSPLPTMDDVARLTRTSDFAPFVRNGVDEGVKRAALKKLFADPYFNVMDGLDVYIDDYGKPDPLPTSMLRKLLQSEAAGLWRDDPAAQPPAGPPAATVAPASAPNPPALPAGAADETAADEDADLRLQPHDAAGRQGDSRDAGEDAGRER